MTDVGLIFLGCAFVLGTAGLVVLQWRFTPQFRTPVAWPYAARRPLDHTALVVHDALANALPGHVILANVPLAQLVTVTDEQRRRPWERRLDGLTAQFVVCSARGDVLGVVELLGGGLASEREHERRREKERVLEAAGVRVLRVRPSRLPDAARLRDIFPITVPAARDAGPRQRPRWLRVVK